MIEPALTAEEWAEAQACKAAWRLFDSCQGEQPDQCRYLIALNNDALPDDDPRKITRETIRAMRLAAARFGDEPVGVSAGWLLMDARWHNLAGKQRARHEESARTINALADALESYLPPAIV
jgi:hypothetical protein